ncbi:MAG: oxidoreductase [Chloroflexota bacterium]|nr:oxidoreductase [Chloroflexota bacterium]
MGGRWSGRWTAADIPELNGRIALVTGASSGTGYAAAVELARQGAETILACRSPERGGAALAGLRASVPGARAKLMDLDLACLESIADFADEFQRRHSSLDILVNNAGVMAAPYLRTRDGFELQVGINHLGHFALTGHLLGMIAGTPGSRIVTVSSLMHRFGRIDREGLMHSEANYSTWGAYARSKLYNLLFAYHLDRLFSRAGIDAASLAAHPGYTATNLGSRFGRRRPRWRQWLRSRLIQGPPMGALPILRAATAPEAVGGQYYGPRGLFGERGHPVLVSSSRLSRSEPHAQRVWEMSAQLTGVEFAGLHADRDV